MSKDYATLLVSKREELEQYKAARSQILSTGQSWRLRNGEDSREMTNVSLAQVVAQIAVLEREIAQLEDIVDGQGSYSSAVRIRARAL